MNKKEHVRNTFGLKACSDDRNKETIKKVNKTIEKMKRSKNKPINFSTVAKEAGVAKATLYNNLNLREQIKGLRTLAGAKTKGDVEKIEVAQINDTDKIYLLREQIRKLKSDKKKLIIQLEGLEEIKEENNYLKKRLKE